MRSWLEKHRMPVAIAVGALLLALPSVVLGPVLDDHGFRRRLVVEGLGPDQAFCFGETSGAQRARYGPWWAGDAPTRWCFLRPLSALTHWLDYRLWPDAVWWMRFENCALYALLAGLAALAYRRLHGSEPGAGLAALMFAVDEAHAHSLAMVAARNTLLSAALALLALLAHDAQRRAPSRLRAALAAGVYALALASGEGGVGALAYLGVYALRERAPTAERVRSLLPYGVLTLAWAVMYARSTYGVVDGAFYRDPRADPLGVLVQGALDLPVWLATQLGIGFATASLDADPALVRAAGTAVCALLALLLWPALRASPVARAYGAGMVLALLPLCLTVPQDRLLVLASFGAHGLVSCALARVTEGRLRRVGRGFLRAIHLGLAPLAFVPTYLLAGAITRAETKVERVIAPIVAADAGSGIVVVRAPIPGTLAYTLARRRSRAQPLPPYAYELYAAPSALTLTRVEAHTLELAPATGWCARRNECFGSGAQVFSVGQQRVLAHLGAEIRALDARGKPQRVRFRFGTPLEDPARRWLVWTAGGLVPFVPPALGQSRQLPPLSRLTAFR